MRVRNTAAIALLVALHAYTPRPTAQRAPIRPNILLVTLDTVRADRMGFLGSTRGLTPALDAFARGAVVFTRAYAQAPITTTSHATILSGTYPPFHGVRDFGTALPETVPWVADIARRAGYRTAAFVGSLILDPRAGTAPGFDRGFEVYDAGFHLRRPGENRYETVERRGDEVVARALRWLASSSSSPSRPSGPFFLWVHLFDAHDPYDPPRDLRARFSSSPYDGEIAAVDRAVARLLQAVPADTIVAIAGDHGEALGDHGEDTHGVFLYDATLHVPLLLRLRADQRPAPDVRLRAASRVRLVDVAPTLVEAAGLRVPAEMQGESLLHIGNRVADRPVYAETDYPRQAFGWSGLLSWRSDTFLFVQAPRRELYDEPHDPASAKNLAEADRTSADRLARDLEQFIRRAAAGAGTPSTASDPALPRRLSSLGYVGGSSRSAAGTVDPKDRIDIANTLHTAVAAVEDGAFARAIPLLQKVTRDEPTIPIAQLNLGVALARTRQTAAAIEPLRRAIALDPDALIAHYELASALYDTGDLPGAAEHFAVVARRMPEWADARYSLGSVYARIDRVPDALTELRAAVRLDPRHFRANLLLGRLLTLQGQAATAVKYLQTAAEVEPRNAEAHSFLGDAYEKAGNAAAASAERQRAQELTKR